MLFTAVMVQYNENLGGKVPKMLTCINVKLKVCFELTVSILFATAVLLRQCLQFYLGSVFKDGHGIGYLAGFGGLSQS